MLKTNSKRARENVRAYVKLYADFTNYEENTPDDFGALAIKILEIFRNEHGHDIKRIGEQNAFFDWCAGLPSILDTCYFYNRSAVDDLGAILEESEDEKSRFTEEQAEKTLTYLIYRELKNARG